MLRSMYSGISGMKGFQTKLDVIGNNIANVNTYGFKKGRVIFKDLISQTQAGASGASQTRGGVNAKQVGLGSQLAAIDTVHGSGSLQTTGRGLDLAISGEGFFMVGNSVGAAGAATGINNISYTRAGNFYMDANGYLVNGDGKYLVGYSNNPANNGYQGFDTDKAKFTSTPGTSLNVSTAKPIVIPTTAQSMSISQDGTISFVDANGDLQYAGTIYLAKFPNAEGLEKNGNNYFGETQNSGTPHIQLGSVDGIGEIVSGAVEMSNVDLSEEFTEMIVAQRGFQANTRIITTSDEILQELVNLKR